MRRLVAMTSKPESSPARIRVAALDKVSDWQDFVRRCPSACVYHDLRWKAVFERTFGHRCHYLVASECEEVCGVLPLVEIRSRLFGHRIVSLPFVSYGGMLADGAQAAKALSEAAIGIARAAGVETVELRQSEPLPLAWSERKHKAAIVIPLAGDLDACWSRLSSRLRGKIRKAGRSGARFEALGGGGLRPFYAVFARNMRDLGTPVYPLSFFSNIADAFRDSFHCLLVRSAGRPVAAALGLGQRGMLHLPWISADYSCGTPYVNEFLYWSVIEWAHAAGFGAVDLGRSTIGSGNYRFKMQWAPDVTPLHWYSWSADGRPAADLSPANPRYSLAISCWRRLPLAVANRLGPKIVRWLP